MLRKRLQPNTGIPALRPGRYRNKPLPTFSLIKGGHESRQPPMYEGILSAIGNTPLVRLRRFFADGDFQLFAKIEALNPGGSMKDRPALAIMRYALEAGDLKQDSV